MTSRPKGWMPPRPLWFTLPNGLRVWLFERESFPYETVHLVLHAGAHADPPGRQGLATMAADLLDCGTPNATALEISAALEQYGSSVVVRGGLDGTTITLSSLQRHLAPSLSTMGAIVGSPSFPAAELDRVRKRRLSALAQQRDHPSAVAHLVFQRLLYGEKHPYGSDAAGTEGSLSLLTREECAAFHAGYVRPGRSTIFLLGRTGEDEARRLLERSFGGWEGSTPADSLPPLPSDLQSEIVIIDRPGSTQSEIRLGAPGIPRNHPDFFPSILLNRIFGGEFNSRLNANLREKRGLTYGAWSSFGFGKFGGPIQIGTAVESAATGEAFVEIIAELERMCRVGASPEEVERAREGIAGGFALAFETPSQIAGIFQNAPLYGLPEGYYDTYLDRLAEVDTAQVNDAASRMLDHRRMKAVIVGDAQSIVPSLRKSLDAPFQSSPEPPFGPTRVGTLADFGL